MTRPLTRWRDLGRWSWRIEYKQADCWIGLFWNTERLSPDIFRMHVWVCVLPMLPIHFSRSELR